MQVYERICKDMEGKLMKILLYGIQEVVGSIPFSSALFLHIFSKLMLFHYVHKLMFMQNLYS